MTVDTPTRANATLKHVQLKKSLTQSRLKFRDHVQHEPDLFRTLPSMSEETSKDHLEHTSPRSKTPKEVVVRLERIHQCCKRVRIWRRHTSNPLLQYKQQLIANAATKSGSKTTDHRMHISILMTMIVEIYEQKMNSEVGAAAASQPPNAGVTETFPEFIVRFVVSRAPTRRVASEQLNSAVSSLLVPSFHARVRVFASLCGLDEHGYNSHEKIMGFLHILECTHRYKVQCGGVSGLLGLVQRVEDIPMVDVVFHNVGMSQVVVQRVITELFEEEYYWNFRFWHSHFRELRVNYAWPEGAKEELIERALGLATSSRNVTLTSSRKIDVDLFLELLLDTWTQRIKCLVDQLEAATDLEERKNAATLQHKQMVQDARNEVLPLTTQECEVFDELVREFWHAEVPWMDRKVQRKLLPVSHTRPLLELAELYKTYVKELDQSKKEWEWSRWPWDIEWEWGAILVLPTESDESSPPMQEEYSSEVSTERPLQ